MKNEDTKITTLCHCGEDRPTEKQSIKNESKPASLKNQLTKTTTETSKPWSVFGDLYWI